MGLTVSVIDDDPDYLLLEVVGDNARFRGTTNVYLDPSGLRGLADAITGFPASPQDVRTYTLGVPDPKFARRFCRVELKCRDISGHAQMRVEIEDDHEPGYAAFVFPIEAAAVDRFVEALAGLQRARSGEARLADAL